MNERIKELSKQAWEWAEQQEYNDPAQEFSDILEQKFAELIVRECAEVADNTDAIRQKWEGIGKYVKKHFGVE